MRKLENETLTSKKIIPMIRKVQFESQERRINQVLAALKENGINSIEEANEICDKAGVDPYLMCE